VRRHAGRYQLIGGRKRLAAALAAGIGEVPCIVRDVDEAGAAALAEATT
jgi:ParB-like chromosome segregation protein Spo0J